MDAGAVELLPRWDETLVADWLRPPREGWNEVQSVAEVILQVLADRDSDIVRLNLATEFFKLLADDQSLRRKLCRFRLQQQAPTLSEDRRAAIESMAVRLWDGMRNLPFTEEQVANALARTIAMELTIERDRLWNGRGWEGVFQPVILDLVKVDLGMIDGTGGSAFLPEPLFRSALRSDLKTIFHSAHLADFENTKLLLQIVKSPEILFALDRLAELFAEYLIPTQILMVDTEQPVIFNPALLATFGAP